MFSSLHVAPASLSGCEIATVSCRDGETCFLKEAIAWLDVVGSGAEGNLNTGCSWYLFLLGFLEEDWEYNSYNTGVELSASGHPHCMVETVEFLVRPVPTSLSSWPSSPLADG